MCGSPSKATVPRARPATGGTKRITVPARPQSTSASALHAAGRDRPVAVVRVVDPGAQGGQRGGHEQGVARAQGTSYDARAGRRSRPAPARGWSATCCRAATRPGPPGWIGRGAGQGSVTRAPYRGQECMALASLASRWASWARRRPRGARPTRPGGRARPGRAVPSVSTPARSRPPRIETFLKKLEPLLGLGLGIGLVPEAVTGDRGRHEGRRQDGRSWCEGRGRWRARRRPELDTGVDPDQGHGVARDRGARDGLLGERDDPVGDRLGLRRVRLGVASGR